MFRDRHRSSRGGVADRGERLTAPSLAPRCDAVSSDAALDSLLRSMREERGLAAATLHNRGRALRPFLAWLAARGRPWHETSAEDVTAYLASQSRWSRATIAQHVHSLRSFFRHGAEQGWCPPHVAAQIDAPRLYTHERLPQGPPWTHVRELLDAHRGDTASQLRNRAMLLLLTVYGFRSGEVRGLTLDDLDWDQEVAIQGVLMTRLLASQSAVSDASPDQLLTAEEVAKALGVTRRWVQRRARRLPFARRLSAHAVRYSESGLKRWMANRRMSIA